MIAPVSTNELEDACELAEEFHKALGMDGQFNGEYWKDQWEQIIDSGKGLIECRYSGNEMKEAIGVVFYEDGFTAEKRAAVSFWYVRGGNSTLAKGQLMSTLETSLRNMGVTWLNVSVKIDERYDGVLLSLGKRGYIPIETVMKKRL